MGPISANFSKVIFPSSASSKVTKLEIPIVSVTSTSDQLTELKKFVAKHLNMEEHTFYLMQNGRILNDTTSYNPHFPVSVILRVFGGKGGFGSMLKSIGSQIEKNRNQDACRDLSGRRLRDVKEEKRLQLWLSRQAEMDMEKQERKERRLKRLRNIQEEPRILLEEDPDLNHQREEISNSLYEAVDQGFESQKESAKQSVEHPSTSTSTSTSQTKSSSTGDSDKPVPPAKKNLKRLMTDGDFDSDLSSEDSDCEPSVSKIMKVE